MVVRTLLHLTLVVLKWLFRAVSTISFHLGILEGFGEGFMTKWSRSLPPSYVVDESEKGVLNLKYEVACYNLIGPKDSKKPLVVFMHGFSFFRFYWNRLANLMAENGYRVLLFDFYGQGESGICDDATVERLEQIYGHEGWKLLSEQVDEMLNVLDLPQKELIVVGHSLGGLVAAEFAKDSSYKNKVRSLVLMNPVGMKTGFDWLYNFFSSFLQLLQLILRYRILGYIVVEGIGAFLKYTADLWKLTYDDLLLSLAKMQHPCELERQLNNTHTKDDGINQSSTAVSNKETSWRLSHSFEWLVAMTRERFGVIENSELLVKCWLYQLQLNGRRPLAMRTALRHFNFFTDFSKLYSELDSRVTRTIDLSSPSSPSSSSPSNPSTSSTSSTSSISEITLTTDNNNTANENKSNGNIQEQEQKEGFSIIMFWGTSDSIFPISNLHQYESVMPRATFVKVDGADHSVFMQRPVLVGEKLLSYLEQVQQSTQ